MSFLIGSLLGVGTILSLLLASFFEPLAIARPFIVSNIGIALGVFLTVGLLSLAAYLKFLDSKLRRLFRVVLRGGFSFLISSLLVLLPVTQLGVVEEVPEWQRDSLRTKQNSTFLNLSLRDETAYFESYQGNSYRATITHIEGQYSRNEFGRKPSGYFSLLNNAVILAQGDGSIIALKVNDATLISEAVSIPSNLDEILDQKISEPNWFSIKGIFTNHTHVYLSVSKQSDVEIGQAVQEGQALCTIEAMKMENILRAERRGVVAAITCAPGDCLAVDEIIIDLG